MQKTIKTRVQHKHDLEFNWNLATGFIPLQGELIVYDIEVDDVHQYIANDYVVHNCTTSVQTGMHYPMGSLIINCNKERRKVQEEIAFGAQYRSVPKIVADGGFKRIDQIVKALALGADYVMLGEVLAMTTIACGEPNIPDTDECEFTADKREYYGMSTKKAQKLINEASLFRVDNFNPKHSEGIVRYVPIKYSVKDWVADFEHALRSSMSYASARTLKDYIGEVEYHYMTPVTYNAYMK